MAKTSTDDFKKRSEAAATALFDPSQALNGLEPILQASNKMLENWMAVSSEILEFSRARLDRNLEISKAIARSSSIDEAMGLHADHARSTVREYFTECGKQSCAIYRAGRPCHRNDDTHRMHSHWGALPRAAPVKAYRSGQRVAMGAYCNNK